MKIFFTDQIRLPLPDGHSFPIEKYELLKNRLLAESIVGPEDIFIPEPVIDEMLLRVHDKGYIERVKQGQLTKQEVRRIGFPWSQNLVERSRRSCGATLQACREAVEKHVAVHLAGGTHHAFRDRGEGYCVFNDCAVAARTVQFEGLVKRVVILDCDVHQGNGTAAIFKDDPTVFTFSIHGEKNFPFKKEQSDLDIPLEDGTDDQDYMRALEWGLEKALNQAKADLAIYLSGADPYKGDRFGRLSLSKPGLAERDRLVFRQCRKRSLPIVVTMGGGYARRVQDTVDIHTETVRLAAQYASQTQDSDPAQKIRDLSSYS